MHISYYAEDDAVVLIAANSKGGGGGTVRDDFRVILEFMDEDSEDVTRVDVLDVSRFLPLNDENGYDAATDTLTLGDKPVADFRVVDHEDFVSYLQWFDDGSEWDVVAVDLRRASVHLAKAIAAQWQPLDIAKGKAED